MGLQLPDFSIPGTLASQTAHTAIHVPPKHKAGGAGLGMMPAEMPAEMPTEMAVGMAVGDARGAPPELLHSPLPGIVVCSLDARRPTPDARRKDGKTKDERRKTKNEKHLPNCLHLCPAACPAASFPTRTLDRPHPWLFDLHTYIFIYYISMRITDYTAAHSPRNGFDIAFARAPSCTRLLFWPALPSGLP